MMIYHEGLSAGEPDSSYGREITVVPHLKYGIKVEVLRNDLAGDWEKVSAITVSGVNIGECNPDGTDFDCTFYDCTSSMTKTTLSFQNESVKVVLHFQGHSSDCVCDKDTWEGVTEQRHSTNPNFTSMIAVARITLTPIKGAYIVVIIMGKCGLYKYSMRSVSYTHLRAHET